jgi:hypothetical protein
MLAPVALVFSAMVGPQAVEPCLRTGHHHAPVLLDVTKPVRVER